MITPGSCTLPCCLSECSPTREHSRRLGAFPLMLMRQKAPKRGRKSGQGKEETSGSFHHQPLNTPFGKDLKSTLDCCHITCLHHLLLPRATVPRLPTSPSRTYNNPYHKHLCRTPLCTLLGEALPAAGHRMSPLWPRAGAVYNLSLPIYVFVSCPPVPLLKIKRLFFSVLSRFRAIKTILLLPVIGI